MTALQALDRTILLCRDYVADGLRDEEICQCLQSTRIVCISDLSNVSSHSGQSALVTLVSLLSRMGMQVDLCVPEISLTSLQPPFSGQELLTALIASSEALIPGAKVSGGADLNPDLVFVLGDSRAIVRNNWCWRLCGGPWTGELALNGTTQPWKWTCEWPVGAMVSAALGAAEAFKFAIGRLPLRNRSDQTFLDPSTDCRWDFGGFSLPDDGIDLGSLDIISAGAICQAALYVLTRLPGIRATGRILDDDTTAISNLNRNMLSTISDVDVEKVRVVTDRCGVKVHLEPIGKRLVSGCSECGSLSARVLVGVDDIPSRWEAQRLAPGWLVVSGTSHFNVSSSDHGRGQPCSGCLHSMDDPAVTGSIPTVSFVSFWAGLAMAVRLVREAFGKPYSFKQQHLWLAPLRMDQPNGAMWLPVAPNAECPVGCLASRNL